MSKRITNLPIDQLRNTIEDLLDANFVTTDGYSDGSEILTHTITKEPIEVKIIECLDSDAVKVGDHWGYKIIIEDMHFETSIIFLKDNEKYISGIIKLLKAMILINSRK